MSETKQYTIGGSEAAVILGLSTWGTPLGLYLQKKGMIQRPNLDDKEYVKAGKYQEDTVARWYADETERRVLAPADTDFRGADFLGVDALGGNYACKGRPWMTCHPDRGIYPPKERAAIGILEAKTAMFMKREEWADEPPLQYQVQLQHNLEVMGASWGSLAVLIGGSSFRWQDQERNEAFIAHLIEKEMDFIRRLEESDPPPPVGSDIDKKALGDLFGRAVDSSIALPSEAIEWDEKLAEATSRLKQAEEDKTLYENFIKQAMGEHTIGILPGHRGSFTWNLVEKKGKPLPPECLEPEWRGYIQKPSSYRLFLRKTK